MTAPDQCCINVKKLLSMRRRPHMTHLRHGRLKTFAAQKHCSFHFAKRDIVFSLDGYDLHGRVTWQSTSDVGNC
jgi:hypothetical protein